MAMNGKVLAAEVLKKMGGKVDKRRRKAFEDFCEAIVEHIQTRGQVQGITSDGKGVTGKVL